MRPTPRLLAALLLFAAPAVAGVDVVSDPDADFSAIGTYAWKTDAVVEAPSAEAQGWIVAAVDRELKAHGLRPVEPGGGDPDVWIVTYAGTGLEVGYTAPYLNGTWTKDIQVYNVQDVVKGTLVVSLVDPVSDKLLWRGIATRSINPKKSDKLKGKIDKAARDMFKRYPESR